MLLTSPTHAHFNARALRPEQVLSNQMSHGNSENTQRLNTRIHAAAVRHITNSNTYDGYDVNHDLRHHFVSLSFCASALSDKKN